MPGAYPCGHRCGTLHHGRKWRAAQPAISIWRAIRVSRPVASQPFTGARARVSHDCSVTSEQRPLVELDEDDCNLAASGASQAVDKADYLNSNTNVRPTAPTRSSLAGVFAKPPFKKRCFSKSIKTVSPDGPEKVTRHPGGAIRSISSRVAGLIGLMRMLSSYHSTKYVS